MNFGKSLLLYGGFWLIIIGGCSAGIYTIRSHNLAKRQAEEETRRATNKAKQTQISRVIQSLASEHRAVAKWHLGFDNRERPRTADLQKALIQESPIVFDDVEINDVSLDGHGGAIVAAWCYPGVIGEINLKLAADAAALEQFSAADISSGELFAIVAKVTSVVRNQESDDGDVWLASGRLIASRKLDAAPPLFTAEDFESDGTLKKKADP